MSKKPNGKFCLYCSKPLVGRQTKYCSDRCRQAYIRSLAKDNTEQTTVLTEQTPNNAVELFETIKTNLARAEGTINTLEIERDRLIQERDKAHSDKDKLSEKLIESEREKGELRAENKLLMNQVEDSKKPSEENNRLITERDKIQEENIELREKLVRREEKINQLEEEKENKKPQQNQLTWVVIIALLIFIIIVSYVITQGI